MLRPLLLLLTALCLAGPLGGQDLNLEGEYGTDWGGYLFGFKGGATLANQDWSGLETELLLGYHGDLFVESIPSQGRFSFYGQLGYHMRGSRISRRRAITFNGGGVTLPADDFRFHNLALGVGAKSVFKYTRRADLYYVLGLRADYSFANNLSEYDLLAGSQGVSFRANYPFDDPMVINEVTGGATFGAGASIPLTDKIGGLIELTAHPDFTFQYDQGPIPNVIDPFGAGNRTIPARMIRNFTIELSVGLRFLRSWRYVK